MKELSRSNIGLTALVAFILVVGYGSVSLAQTPTPTTKPTDYAVDVQSGQAAIKSDPVVAANAKEVNDSESDSGDVDNEATEVKEAVEAAEATEPAESSGGESSGGGEAGGSKPAGQEGAGGTNSSTTGGQR